MRSRVVSLPFAPSHLREAPFPFLRAETCANFFQSLKEVVSKRKQTIFLAMLLSLPHRLPLRAAVAAPEMAFTPAKSLERAASILPFPLPLCRTLFLFGPSTYFLTSRALQERWPMSSDLCPRFLPACIFAPNFAYPPSNRHSNIAFWPP